MQKTGYRVFNKIVFTLFFLHFFLVIQNVFTYLFYNIWGLFILNIQIDIGKVFEQKKSRFIGGKVSKEKSFIL